MLKKIAVDQLQLGMHLKEFCGSWMDHPFWRTGFVLTNPVDLDLILRSSIKEVWIDASLGDDVPEGQAVMDEEEVEVTPTEAVKKLKVSVVPHLLRDTTPIPADKEMARAAMICQESKAAVIAMFEEARMGNAVDVGGARQLVENISDSVARNPGAIISLARLKTADDYTYMHSVAVSAMMVALAKQLGLSDAQTRSSGMAGLLHDVGKVAMPPEVLNKPGKLTEAEFTLIRTHPVQGIRLLKATPDVDPVALDVVLHHHEKMDGTGYPDRLKGDQISLYAKMGAVCDVYDAITSNRPYKAGWDPAESLRKMAEWTKSHFDLMVFQAFVKSMGIYPVGSLVRLNSGRIGVVTEQSAGSLTTPIMKVFFSTKSNMRIMPYVLDLSLPGCTEKIFQREDPEKWKFPDLNEMWSGLLLPT